MNIDDISKNPAEKTVLLLLYICIELQKLNTTLDKVTGHDEDGSYYDFVITKEVKR